MGYKCSSCEEIHEGLPDICADKPDHWWDVPEEERESRIELTTDTCIIDGEHFFVRGNIDIPVHGQEQDFSFGVWVSQKKENFSTYLENFESSEIGPFFGWLCTNLRCYEHPTLLLQTMAHFQGGGLRPTIELEPSDHPLSRDQREGICLERAWEIAHFYIKS